VDRLGLELAGFILRGLSDCLEPKLDLSWRKTYLRACSCTRSGGGPVVVEEGRLTVADEVVVVGIPPLQRRRDRVLL
jgi:hypothetical protein